MQTHRDNVPFACATLHGSRLRGTESDNNDVCTSVLEKGLYETLHYGPGMLAALIRMRVGWPQQKAFAAVPLDTMYQYKRVNENSGFVLDISSPSLTAGSTALQGSDNGTTDPLWQCTRVGSGYDEILQPLICLLS